MKMISDEKVIDGSSLYNMLRIAFTSLSYNESYLNDINTFPVSDSDTGTNMKRTLRMGLLTTSQEQTAGELIRSLADNMSLSSRGNSGFILSQYFMGLSEYLRDKNVITIEDFSKAIVHAYKVAYASVVNPAEGTMLTVMREGAKQTLDKFNNLSNGTFADFFNIFSESIFASTLKPSSQMSLLETNNVVDTQEPVNSTVTETQGTIKEPVVETPTTENNNSSNSQPVVEDNTPPTQSTTGIADNIEHITTNTKVPINQTNSTQSVAGSINSIVSGNDSIPTLDPETEPSVGPDATLPTLDAEEVINQGELTDVTELPSTLDVVSIDKDITPTTEVKTSAAPIALGLGATGLAAAAGIGGPKLVENYKQKHNSFSFINKEEDDSFDFPEEETEQQEEKQTSPEKFDPKSLLEEYE